MILNLTQHLATSEQLAAGVVDLDEPARATLSAMLTFERIPTREEIAAIAEGIANLANSYAEEAPDQQAMIGGAPWLMGALEIALLEQRIQPIYAFSVRESIEQSQPDGSIRKVNVFRHTGFVEP